MSDRLMYGRVLRIMAVSLSPLLQRLSDSSTQVSPHQPRAPVRMQLYVLDPVERRQPSNEAGLTLLQAGRGPPCRSSSHIVRDNASTLHRDRKWRVIP